MFSFVCIWNDVYDPTEDEKRDTEKRADKLVKNFKYFVDASPKIDITSWNSDKVFRNDSYLGAGKGLTMTIEILDTSDYCNINTSRIKTLLD